MGKPKILVSACLLGYPYRYDGKDVSLFWLKDISEYVNFIPVCPEVGVGLGVPRSPIKLVREQGFIKMIQVSTNKDLTYTINRFARNFLKDLGTFHGFIGKSKSPSCSLGDAKVFHGVEDEVERGRNRGLFYDYLRKKRFYIPAISDVDQHNKIDEFFIKVFMLYDLEIKGIDGFLKENIYLLKAFNPRIGSSPSLSDILRSLRVQLRNTSYLKLLKRFVSIPAELERDYLRGYISRQEFADAIIKIRRINDRRLIKYLKPYPFKLKLYNT